MITEKDVYGQEPIWDHEDLKAAYKALEDRYRTVGNYKSKTKMEPLNAIKQVGFGAIAVLLFVAVITLVVKTGVTIVQVIWNLW